MHALLHSVPLALQQAIVDPYLWQRLLDIHGQVWVSLLWGHCSFLLGPSVHKVLVCALQESVYPVLCKFWQLHGGVNGDLLQGGLCHAQVCCTQSLCRVSALEVGHYCPVPLQKTLKHSPGSVSEGFLGPGGHKVCLSPLNVSGRYGV